MPQAPRVRPAFSVTSSNVQSPRLRRRTPCGELRLGRALDGGALHDVEVHPAVVVVVERPDPPALGLEDVALLVLAPRDVAEDDAGRGGHVDELGTGRPGRVATRRREKTTRRAREGAIAPHEARRRRGEGRGTMAGRGYPIRGHAQRRPEICGVPVGLGPGGASESWRQRDDTHPRRHAPDSPACC